MAKIAPDRGTLTDTEIEETVEDIIGKYSWQSIRNSFQHYFGRRLTRGEQAYLKARAKEIEAAGEK